MKIFFLVLRNIARNKKNCFIIAFLVALITFLFFFGNTIFTMSNQSIRNAFISSITGDVVLQARSDVTMNLFGANMPILEHFFTIPVLPAFDSVMYIVKNKQGIKGITSQVSGRAFMNFAGTSEAVLLSGVDAQSYFSMFPGIILEQGRFLEQGEFGAMITMERAKRIKSQTGYFPQINDMMLLTSGGELGFRIREVPLIGIFRYQNPGLFMNEIILIDPQTVRVLNAIQVAASSDVAVSGEAVSLLDMDFDDIFAFDATIESDAAETEFTAGFLQSWLYETRVEDAGIIDLIGGDWNFIIISLENSRAARSFVTSINRKLEPFDVVAVDWRIAAGMSAVLILMVQALFNLGMLFVCVAGVITVINILLIAVFRRTREIGTLRAIGASDFYIGSLVLYENVFLTVIAGAIGVLSGFLFLQWVNSLGFYIGNELIASLLGGNILAVEFITYVAFLSFILAVLLGIAVSIYPISVTLKIEPIEAVRQG